MKKLMIQGKIDGRRKRGRISNRYIDQIMSTMHLELPKMIRRVDNREAWRDVIDYYVIERENYLKYG